MSYREEVVQFACAKETLLGIIAHAEPVSEVGDLGALGVLVLVGGPQYRVGSHRQFVLLSRYLADNGFTTMRFDFEGMGDSSGTFPGFENADDNIAAALDVFQRQCPSIQRFVLWGLCDAASAALLYCEKTEDPRVAGLCLLNPWVRSEVSLAKAHLKHYYFQRLSDREFWRKILRGRFGLVRSVRDLGLSVGTVFAAPNNRGPKETFQARMAIAMRRPMPVLLILGGNDLTAREFETHALSDARWRGVLSQGHVDCQRVPDADHTFSTQIWRHRVERVVLKWLIRF